MVFCLLYRCRSASAIVRLCPNVCIPAAAATSVRHRMLSSGSNLNAQEMPIENRLLSPQDLKLFWTLGMLEVSKTPPSVAEV